MSEPRNQSAHGSGAPDREPDAEAVAAYLTRHPDFLLQRPQLVETIELEHRVAGAASLVSRQLERLRERNRALRGRLDVLIENARVNEQLMAALLDLTLALARAATLPAQLEYLAQALRDSFRADTVRLLLRDAAAAQNLPDWVRTAPELPGWYGDLARRQVSCGEPRDRARAAGELGGTLGAQSSWALLALRARGEPLGILALGSEDPQRFTPQMSTDFLAQLARMLGALLKLPETAAASAVAP